MSELKPYICTQCGGKVNRATLVCEMCGTQFKEDCPDHIIVVTKPGIHTLRVSRSIDERLKYICEPEELSKRTLEDMSRQLSLILFPFMDIKVEENNEYGADQITATVRVLDPAFRF